VPAGNSGGGGGAAGPGGLSGGRGAWPAGAQLRRGPHSGRLRFLRGAADALAVPDDDAAVGDELRAGSRADEAQGVAGDPSQVRVARRADVELDGDAGRDLGGEPLAERARIEHGAPGQADDGPLVVEHQRRHVRASGQQVFAQPRTDDAGRAGHQHAVFAPVECHTVTHGGLPRTRAITDARRKPASSTLLRLQSRCRRFPGVIPRLGERVAVGDSIRPRAHGLAADRELPPTGRDGSATAMAGWRCRPTPPSDPPRTFRGSASRPSWSTSPVST